MPESSSLYTAAVEELVAIAAALGFRDAAIHVHSR